MRGRLVTALTWHDLADAVDHAQHAGNLIPCREGGLRATRGWISSRPDEQRTAAVKCGSCAALAMCREYVAANPAEAGVLGGVTEFDRKPTAGRPRKEQDR